MMAVERLTSAKNPLIQSLRALKDKKAREAQGAFLVEGEKMIGEALHSGLALRCLLVEDGLTPPEGTDAPMYSVPRSLLTAVCDTVTPQGMCAAFELPRLMSLAEAPDRIVALDDVQDPGNVGTIWRTADAAGFQALLLGPRAADPYSPKVQRAAMGSGFRLPCLRADDLAEALGDLKARGYTIVGSSLRGENIYARRDPGQRMALIIGNEARGMSERVQAQADMLLKLPMRGGAESLNAAVAAGILMYELLRDA